MARSIHRVLLERKLVSREAMKAAPKKSALEGNVSAANSMAVANEMLNEMQRERGSKVTEDLSRYQVTVKRAGSSTPVDRWGGGRLRFIRSKRWTSSRPARR